MLSCVQLITGIGLDVSSISRHFNETGMGHFEGVFRYASDLAKWRGCWSSTLLDVKVGLLGSSAVLYCAEAMRALPHAVQRLNPA